MKKSKPEDFFVLKEKETESSKANIGFPLKKTPVSFKKIFYKSST